jgi:GntR family transcriptional regulator/MocR family aminotransferase
LQAIARHLPEEAEIEGAEAGLHVVLWWKHLPKRDEQKLVVRARDNGVGVYPISSLYANDKHHRRHNCAGVILGYASLTAQQIDRGVRTLKSVVVGMTRDAAPSR